MNAYKKKKQPELVRRTLLDSAFKIAREQGLNSLTLQATAEAAGVSKGGLLHHFPSKQALMEGLIEDIIEKFDHEIDEYISQDSNSYGSFTRAYIMACLNPQNVDPNSNCALFMNADTSGCGSNASNRWSQWLKKRLDRHHETDSAPILNIVRLAVDGAMGWYMMMEDTPLFSADRLIADLIKLTWGANSSTGNSVG